MERRTRKRLLNHAVLALATAGGIWALFAASSFPLEYTKWSVATGYVGVALLVATLLIGPLNALRGVRTALSTDLRRDIGIWAFAIGGWHVVLGLQSHFGGAVWKYFFRPVKEGVGGIRNDLFGWANHTGLIATVLVLLLALLSNDLSLRKLGSGRWKNIQRSNYALFALVAIHTALYQALDKQHPAYAVALGSVVAATLILQLLRIARIRRATP